jgi:O-acetyl-ADP-ribose deacetylase
MEGTTAARPRMRVVEADITTLDADAIVNAANEGLRPGGGVCGAIHRAAGPELEAACRPLAPCPPGESRITPGFALRARWVVHAVGPVWRGGGSGEDGTLARCYASAIGQASAKGARTVAFPAISTGVYGFPPERAAPVAVRAAAEALARHPDIDEVVFCCFGSASADLHRRAVEALSARNGSSGAGAPR